MNVAVRAMLWLLVWLPAVQAQQTIVRVAATNVPGAYSLRDAVEAAWLRQPAARARGAREEEVQARRAAATALLPEPPSLSLAHRTDQFNRNHGEREWEAELDLPLWLPGENRRQLAVVEAEREALGTRLSSGKWKLAGEVREAYWDARLASVELQLAHRKVEETAALAADVERRVKAGDLATVDFNQAKAAEHAASATAAEAEARAYKARQAFFLLTGLETMPLADEAASTEAALDRHPRLADLQRTVALAQAKLAQVARNTRDFPELSLGVRRERGEFTAPFGHTLSARIRIPFAAESRNRPRIASANVELIDAQAEYELERRRIEAEIDVARRELEQARAVARAVRARRQLAAETVRLYSKAFELGELDLPARLRAENERFEAELAHTRAELEAGRAVSRFNQATGLLP